MPARYAIPMIVAIALLLASLLQTAPATRPGIALAESTTLHLPASFRPGDTVNLIVHFHGGGAAVAAQVERAGINAAVVAFSPGGLSSAYATPFKDSAALPALLDRALDELRRRDDVPDDAQLGKVCLTSFSAGFGAVREILKQPDNAGRIDGILMLDSLYSGYTGDPADKVVDPALMAPFVAYARRSAAGKRTLILTHSYLQPSGYAGTHETADFLIEKLGAKSEKMDEPGPGGMRLIRRADKGGFRVLGYEGTEGGDHVRHLQNLGHWLPLLSL